MPRGRVIGPDFWSDETMIGHTPFARLFYIGLWNFAYCDFGHLPDEPFSLKLKVLPADPVNGHELVDELLGSGKLTRNELPGGVTYLHMPSFGKHQSVDSRWKSRCPICNSLKLQEPQPSLSELPKTQATTLVKGKERKEKNSSVQASLERDFDSFWEVYPRKEGKQAAKKKYLMVRRQVEALPILEGARAYALLSLGKEKQHVKMAQGWLTDGRWADELQTSIPLPPKRTDTNEHTHRWMPDGTCLHCEERRDEVDPF